MKILGITGTSGSGKSTLSKILSEYENVKIIDADEIAKQMSIPGTEYLNSIKDLFGQDVFLENGNLNRKKLAEIIYNNQDLCEKLNKLTFKYVVNEIIERIKNTDNNIKFVIIDAPLLFESGLNKYCDYIISLIADEKLKIKRICERDKIDEGTAKSRLKIQKDDLYYIEKSDFIIHNSEFCDLKLEIDNILNKINNRKD